MAVGSSAGASGGAIYAQGIDTELTITGTWFESNSAGRDGGAVYSNAPIAVLDSTFLSNTAGHDFGLGGAVYSASGTDQSLIQNCWFVENSASEGGAWYSLAGNHNVVNSIFVGNSADTRGGALSFPGTPVKQVTFTNSTFYSNKLWGDSGSWQGSDVYITGGIEHEIEIRNSIIYGDYPSLTILDAEFFEEYIDVTYSNIRQDSGTFPGTGNLNVDPQLRFDGLLTAGSPMIGAGTATGAPDDDIHGESRPFGGGIDIGADEFADTDDEGLPDWWQLFYFDALGQDPQADPDEDGLTNLEEYLLGTDPTNPDSAGDGVKDGDSPFDDHNWDGIPSWLAVLIGVDPYEMDHSGNSVSNFEALAFGLDPFDPDDLPDQPLLSHDPENPPVITLHEPQNAVLLN